VYQTLHIFFSAIRKGGHGVLAKAPNSGALGPRSTSAFTLKRVILILRGSYYPCTTMEKDIFLWCECTHVYYMQVDIHIPIFSSSF